MKRNALVLSLFALVLAACGGGPRSGTTSVPGHGAIAIAVLPNPIVAQNASGNTYTFPFDVSVRETGGHPVEITRVSATVYGPGGISFGNETYDAEKIRSMGYSTSIAANGELRYHFAPRREVPDERLFGGVSAELRVEATDDTGATTSASTRVTVTR
ncbi:MAG TPA: hypothetical protein VF824_07805 [Thermoanaerobaculia bacterium]|jgi:hypothetical protein